MSLTLLRRGAGGSAPTVLGGLTDLRGYDPRYPPMVPRSGSSHPRKGSAAASSVCSAGCPSSRSARTGATWSSTPRARRRSARWTSAIGSSSTNCTRRERDDARAERPRPRARGAELAGRAGSRSATPARRSGSRACRAPASRRLASPAANRPRRIPIRVRPQNLDATRAIWP